MKQNTVISVLFFIFASFALSGCQTAADRIGFIVRARIHAKAYSALDPATQDRLRHGIVKDGDTKEMVVIALGRPDSKSAGNEGEEEQWTYTVFSGGYMDGGGRHALMEGGSFSPGKQVRFRRDKLNRWRVSEAD